MSSKTLPTGKVTRSGGALAAEKVGLNSLRQGLHFFALCVWDEWSCSETPCCMFSFVFPLSQLLLRWKELLVPMRNLTGGKRERQTLSWSNRDGIGSESEAQKAPRRNKCCNCVAGAWKEAFGSWRQDSIEWRRVNGKERNRSTSLRMKGSCALGGLSPLCVCPNCCV